MELKNSKQQILELVIYLLEQQLLFMLEHCYVGDTDQNGKITTSTTGGYILFGDGTGADAYRGEIRYAHSTDCWWY